MDKETLTQRLYESIWAAFGIQTAISEHAQGHKDDMNQTTLVNLSCALEIVLNRQHELAEILDRSQTEEALSAGGAKCL